MNLTLSDTIHMLAPAKINLFLSVEGKHRSGYHKLCTVMCAVSMYDSLFFNFNKQKKTVTVTCNNKEISRDKTNIVYKSVYLFFKELKSIGITSDLGIKIHIYKRIPVGAGFGGGSSDAASTLLLLNSKFGHPFSNKSMINIGKKIGADVPFFIISKPVIATGIGDKLKKFTQVLPKFALLVHTGLSLNTSWVYKNLNLNQNLRLTKYKKTLSKFYLNVGRFNFRQHLFNDLESVSEVKFPIISDVKDLLLRSGAVSVLMSGSGSGVFGLFDSFRDAMYSKRFILHNRIGKFWNVHLVKLLV